jgi:uncharacterized protein
MDLQGYLLLALGTFAGAFVQSATGFGFAILAAPVFLAVINATSAIPLLVLLHLVQSAMVVPRLWLEAPRVMLRDLILGALAGCPLGLLAFLHLDLTTLKILVGALILGFTALLILREAGVLQAVLSHDNGAAVPGGWATRATGVASGAMTALLVMPGPPVMLHLMARTLSKEQSRALSLTSFAFCYVFVAMLNAASGTLTNEILKDAAVLAPAVALATWLGARAARVMSDGFFRAAIFALLLASGAGAVWSALS